MSCYHPKHAFQVGYHEKSGKPKYIITNGDKNTLDTKYGIKTEFIEIPCGKCIGCRLEYSKQWAMRCMLEAKQYQNNVFITLTYNDDKIPMKKHIDEETGEIFELPTLQADDLKTFMKDLREVFRRGQINMAEKGQPKDMLYFTPNENIRFFACGEYGDKTKRPHYHIIIFNLTIPDLQLYKRTENGDFLYTSKIIEKIWEKGFTPIGEATWESIAYTARYVMKKAETQKSAKALCNKMGIEPEFIRMSRKGGIGKNYYLENKDKIYECDEIIMRQKNGAASLKPARYFDKLFDIEQPEKLKEIKEKRMEIARQTLMQELYGTDLTKDEYLKIKEQAKLAQIKALKRNQI